MRLTSRKKEILSYFEPDNREWVTGEIGAPPFDVIGVAIWTGLTQQTALSGIHAPHAGSNG